jgi:hypothetical protein
LEEKDLGEERAETAAGSTRRKCMSFLRLPMAGMVVDRFV